jgi:heme-degrading monooxygenase HmoA
MVYINLRLNVADFDKWLDAFQGFESYRRASGSTGTNQIFHDVDDPDNVTLIMEWDEATNAKAFLNHPQTKANMDAAGVTGRPTVLAVQVKA